eukprot:1354762-Amphidinium_carterae.1
MVYDLPIVLYDLPVPYDLPRLWVVFLSFKSCLSWTSMADCQTFFASDACTLAWDSSFNAHCSAQQGPRETSQIYFVQGLGFCTATTWGRTGKVISFNA